MTTANPSDSVYVPDEGLQFVPPMRGHHLTGGLSLLTASNRLGMLFPSMQGIIFFSLLQDAPAESILHGQEGIRHLGTNFFSAADEMTDPVTQLFSISVSARNECCLATAQYVDWYGVANTLHQSNRGADALIATRIASQVRACLNRLERLSIAYRTVLTEAVMKERPSSPSTFTSDKYAVYLGGEYRAMLNELYAMRDAVLAGAFRFRFKRNDPFDMRKIKALMKTETQGLVRLISHSMFSDAGDRLIEHMALYRSVAQHCLGATNPIFGDVYQLRLSTGPFGSLPYVVFPLYDDIEKMREIERGSSAGVLERPSVEEVTRFGELGEYRDALEFSYDCFVRLLTISELLRQESGIEPRPVVITDQDILELTVTDATGKVTRARRDQSGRLVEY
jgi:hypothetical protein